MMKYQILKRPEILLIILALSSCQTVAQEPSGQLTDNPAFDRTIKTYLKFDVPFIKVEDLANQHDSYIILDARSKSEFDVSHIENARFIGFKEFSDDRLRGIPKESKIAVYCSIGYRSEKISRRLNELGYTNVSNVYGSIFEWVNQGYQIVDNSGQITKELHTYNRSWSKWVTKDSIQKRW